MSANIKVVVRVRPLNDKEKELNNRVVVDVVDDRMLVFDPKEELLPFFYQGVQQPNKGFLKRANKELKFVFDYVCDMNATNDVVFETTTKDMLSSLMEGYNCSVFVYGATGAGKTFTMIGNINNPGITYLTMEHLFCLMNSLENDRVFEIGVSYIEVYNENVYDLLKPSNVPLQLREDNKYGVVVAGLTINTIKTARELLNMLENGNKNRTQHPTDANAESSRSHAVFQVFLKMSYKTSGQQRIVKLSMIDLAGSERASATGCVGDRFKEGANINKSLLSLGNCINKLADGSNYIPYRDSKLTRLLKDSLGGNCKTVMIANISPSSISYEDTYNTLKYAARASKIQLTIKKNIVDGDMRVSQYVRINEELKKKIKELEAKLSISETRPVKVPSKEVEASMEKAMQEWQRQIDAAEEEVATAETELLDVMSRARVLALRRRLRTRAARDYADLAHRSSYTHMHELVSEELSRRTRSSALQARAARALDGRVRSAAESRARAARRLRSLLDRALAACPALAAAVRAVHLRREIRLLRARDELRYKLLSIENAEITMITEYLSDMPSMLKKLYLTLKGYDKVPPSLTQEYLEVMKKSKAKGITWSDDDNECDTHFKFIANLDLDNPGLLSDIDFKDDNSIDLDSEDLTDTESRDTENNVNIDNKKVFDDRIDTENRMDKENCPDEEHRLETLVTKHIDSMKKRKGTPIKLTNNETIVINDSFELVDTTRNMNSAKKPKIESNEDIDVNNLNSTFVMAGKVEPLKQNIKVEKETAPVRRPLTDGTNTMNRDHRTVHFAEKARAAKPVVGRALPLRRPGARGAGFGSSLSRDGTPFARPGAQEARDKAHVTQRSVGLKAVRGRERAHHPYSRPAPAARR